MQSLHKYNSITFVVDETLLLTSKVATYFSLSTKQTSEKAFLIIKIRHLLQRIYYNVAVKFFNSLASEGGF